MRVTRETVGRQPARILVTGAAGFIGSHLVERLLDRGDTVIGVDNFDPFYSPDEKRRNLRAAQQRGAFRLLQADCADVRALCEMLGDEPVDVAIHLAARAGARASIHDPVAYARANVLATQAIFELARRRNVTRVVFGSSSSVYGNDAPLPLDESARVDRPLSPYAATKRAGELLGYAFHHVHGTAVAALRYFTAYGPRQRPDQMVRKFATLMLRGEPVPMFGDGTAERDYTWVEDIVSGTVAAVDWTGTTAGGFEIVNIGAGRSTSLERVVELLAEALGVPPRMRRLPQQAGDVRHTRADITKARELLGYRPAVTIEEGIPRFVEWFVAGEESAKSAAVMT